MKLSTWNGERMEKLFVNLVFAVFDVFAFEDRMRKTSKVFILYNWLLMFLFSEQSNGVSFFPFRKWQFRSWKKIGKFVEKTNVRSENCDKLLADELSKWKNRASENSKRKKNARVTANKERKGRVEKQGREVRMWKGFEGVIRGKHYYERVSERLERKKRWLLFARTCTMNLLYFRRYVLNTRQS